MSGSDRLRHVLRKCETDHAPDPRVTVFDVSAERAGGAVVLSGAVLTDHLKARAVEAVEAVADAPVAATDVTVLERSARERTVTAPIAPVRGEPDEDGEQVTQVLYGAALTAYDCDGDGDTAIDVATDADADGAWRRVRTPDGYVGWVEREHLRAVEPIDPDGLVTADRVDVAADPGTVYAGTECEIVGPEEDDAEVAAANGSDGDPIRVRFRTGVEHALPADAVGEVPETTDPDAVVETAREYLGTEYVWGGMTVEGIDCSGLTWMAYRRNGITLPRDADLQRRMGEEVARDEGSDDESDAGADEFVPEDDLEPGDLLFFPGHVALSLGGAEFVHASGSAGEVVENSLDPGHDRYDEDLAEKFELATRLV